MQNQSNSDQQQNLVGSFSPQSDLPPLPPAYQDVNPKEENSPKQDSSVPPVPDFSKITASPKKRFGGGKMFATILGILVLVGGVSAGAVLIQNKQLLQQKAANPPTTFCESEYAGKCVPLNYSCTDGQITTGSTGCRSSEKCGLGTCTIPTTTNDGGGSSGSTTKSWPTNGEACHSTGDIQNTVGGCAIYWCPNGCGNDGKCDEKDSGVYITHSTTCTNAQTELSNYCGQIDVVDTNLSYCIPNDTTHRDSMIQCNSCTNPRPTNRPSTSPSLSPSPSATPGTAPYCSAVVAYSDAWIKLDSTSLANLSAGETINFCVAGTATSGSFDMARFTINGVLLANTVDKRPGTTDYCQSYTIPTDTTRFTISAQIHHSELGWF